MALTAITTLDIPGLTQIIKFNNPAQVDEIDFGNNQIIFKASPTFNLSKSDFLLYINYLNVFNTALILNFPAVTAFQPLALPLSECNFKIGSTRITYDQHSGVNDVFNITYFLNTQIMTFTARASDMTITLQEFFLLIYNMVKMNQQINVN
jgi:hypothetical protein